MKKQNYCVAFNYTEHANVTVKASSEAEALEIVENMLDEHGLPKASDCFDREWQVVQAEVEK